VTSDNAAKYESIAVEKYPDGVIAQIKEVSDINLMP
jgi:hypothetical protein